MKFKYIGEMPTVTAHILCKPGDPPFIEERPNVVSELENSPLFEIIKEHKKITKKEN